MYSPYRPRISHFNMYRNQRSMSNITNNMRNIPSYTAPILGKAITVPKSTGLFKSLLGNSALTSTSKIGLTGILGGISKTINTVNQAMPLINQVKPIFGNVKSVVNVVKGFRNKKDQTPPQDYQTKVNNLNEDSINTSTKQEENLQENYQFTPNKPYFS